MSLQNDRNFDIILYNVTYLDEKCEVIKDKVIAIKDGKIAKILDDKKDFTAETQIDCKYKFVMAGLVDGHLHTSQQLLRGRLLDEKPVIWKRVNVPFESNLNEETSELSAKVAALEMIKNGTTGFVDIGGKYVPNFADVYEKSGLRGRLTYMTNDSPFAPKALTISPKEGLERLIELNKNCKGLIKGYFSVPSLTAVSEEMINTIFSQAIERDIPVQTHMNEYASEVFDFIEKYGERPFEYLEKKGLMSEKFVAAHCIFLSESEKEIVKNYDVKVIHCPFSNCGKGVPETPQLLRQGISVGLGTDGSAHGGLDLFKEIRLFRGVMNIAH
ncbi:MAG: amidohydrolase family protein, partial [Oscillospiraceae bacterium]